MSNYGFIDDLDPMEIPDLPKDGYEPLQAGWDNEDALFDAIGDDALWDSPEEDPDDIW